MTLISLDGTPTPPTEIVGRIKQIHPRLDLRFSDTSYHGEGHKYWAVVMEWEENDKRRRLVKEGRLPLNSAYDVLGYLPLDCPVDQAYGYLVNNFKARPMTAGKLIEWVHKYNENVTASAMEPVNEYAEEVIEKAAMKLAKDTGGSMGKVYATDRRKKR